MTGIEGGFVKGWATNLSGSWQTGSPFTTSPASNLDGIASAGYLDQDLLWEEIQPVTFGLVLNFNCFVSPTPGTLGDERFGSLFGPHQKRLDFSLSIEFPIKESITLQFRTEIINLFNQANLGLQNASIAYTGTNPTNGNFS